ncbi:hypothetical protein ACQP3L_33670, partial [Escherichia coli]
PNTYVAKNPNTKGLTLEKHREVMRTFRQINALIRRGRGQSYMSTASGNREMGPHQTPFLSAL